MSTSSFCSGGSDGIRDGRLAESVVGKCAVHLGNGAGKLVGGVARAWIELAGALELCIDGGAFGSVDGDGADKGARLAAEGESDAIVESGCIGLDGVEESGGKKLAQAAANVVFAEGRALRLGKMTRSGASRSGATP